MRLASRWPANDSGPTVEGNETDVDSFAELPEMQMLAGWTLSTSAVLLLHSQLISLSIGRK